MQALHSNLEATGKSSRDGFMFSLKKLDVKGSGGLHGSCKIGRLMVHVQLCRLSVE